MKHDYKQFDTALLEQIGLGSNTLTDMGYENVKLHSLAMPFCATIHGPRRPVYRVIDGRLQSLRKRGLIRFDGKVWHVCAA